MDSTHLPTAAMAINWRSLGAPQQAEALRICTHSTRTDSHAIGFLPTGAYQDHASRGNLLIVTNNDEIVGYCVHSIHPYLPRSKAVVCWVRQDARMLAHGEILMQYARKRAIHLGKCAIEADVAEDLPARNFWRALGYTKFATKPAGRVLSRQRRREHIIQYRLFTKGPKCPTVAQP